MRRWWFVNNYLKQFLDDNGIKFQTSAAHTQEQNGIAEQNHRTSVESARSEIHARDAPLNMWAEAINCHTQAFNKTIEKNTDVTRTKIGMAQNQMCKTFEHSVQLLMFLFLTSNDANSTPKH